MFIDKLRRCRCKCLGRTEERRPLGRYVFGEVGFSGQLFTGSLDLTRHWGVERGPDQGKSCKCASRIKGWRSKSLRIITGIIVACKWLKSPGSSPKRYFGEIGDMSSLYDWGKVRIRQKQSNGEGACFLSSLFRQKKNGALPPSGFVNCVHLHNALGWCSQCTRGQVTDHAHKITFFSVKSLFLNKLQMEIAIPLPWLTVNVIKCVYS